MIVWDTNGITNQNACCMTEYGRCPHCYKLFRPHKEGESPDWNHCPNGHRTLCLRSADRNDIQQELIDDYRSWIPFYKEHHHRIRRIFDDRRKVFRKVMFRDRQNIFKLYPDQIDKMLLKAYEVGDLEHRERKGQ